MKYLAFLLIILSTCIRCGHAQEWQQLPSVSIGKPLQHIIVDDCDYRSLLGATDSEVYHSTDGGTSWTKLFSISRTEDTIQEIIYKPAFSPEIYLITANTLYYSNAPEKSWEKALKNFDDNPLTALSVNPFDPTEAYVGTAQGLYSFKRSHRTFTELGRYLKNEYIRTLAFHPNIKDLLFIATERGFYRFDLTAQQPRVSHVFLRSSITLEGEPPAEAHDQIIFFPDDDNTVFVLLDGRLYASSDRGLTLKETYRNNEIRHIAPLSSAPHAVTTDTRSLSFTNLETAAKDVYDDGLYSAKIHDIALHDFQHTIVYAATDRGLFSLRMNVPSIETTYTPVTLMPSSLDRFRETILAEPTVNSTQRAAIRYANVANSKISTWQRNARLRALIPTVSCGLDNSRKDNIDIDRGSTTIPDLYMIGPKTKDFSWDIDFKWDLANILWNNDANTITYREKQMIEMREDIVNEVTSLYFERRKKQLKLFSHHVNESREYLLLCMEIDELTARIDGLTGSWFSENMHET
jgi:phage pi2 protein 07